MQVYMIENCALSASICEQENEEMRKKILDSLVDTQDIRICARIRYTMCIAVKNSKSLCHNATESSVRL